ncbi:hypothetical protein [Veillonella sp.]|uniref:hypothetical protein n=1 Tax=Veillonella sp. TaxID=1926307 RepID=UPI0025F736BC|nr:hypothetical protein [Veillonella sp.]
MKSDVMQRFYATINTVAIEDYQVYELCLNILKKIETQFSIEINDQQFTKDLIQSLSDLIHKDVLAPQQVKKELEESINGTSSLPNLKVSAPLESSTKIWTKNLKELAYNFLSQLQPTSFVQQENSPSLAAHTATTSLPQTQQVILNGYSTTPEQAYMYQQLPMDNPYIDPYTDPLQGSHQDPYGQTYRMNPFSSISNPQETVLSKALSLGASKETAIFLQNYLAQDKLAAYPIFTLLDTISQDMFQTSLIPYLQARQLTQVAKNFPDFTKSNFATFTLNDTLVRTVYFDKKMDVLSISIPEDLNLPNSSNRLLMPFIRGMLVKLYQEQMQPFGTMESFNPITMNPILPLNTLLIPTVFRRMLINFGMDVPQRLSMVFDTNKLMVYPEQQPQFGLRAFSYFNGVNTLFSRSNHEESNGYLLGYIAAVIGVPQSVAQRIFINSDPSLRNYYQILQKAGMQTASVSTTSTTQSDMSQKLDHQNTDKKEESPATAPTENTEISSNTESSVNKETTDETIDDLPIVDDSDGVSPYDDI